MSTETEIEAREAIDIGEAVGVWHELELALEGKSSYNGTITEIYAYRLVPPRLSGCTEGVRAQIAGRNLTRLLRHFVELHAGVDIEIEREPLDLVNGCPPFAHRVHLRLVQVRRIRKQLSHDLHALRIRMRDVSVNLPLPQYSAWDEATLELLLALSESGEKPHGG